MRLFQDVNAMLSLPLYTKSMEELLSSYHMKEMEDYPLGTQFSFRAPGRMGKIQYTLPYQEELTFQDSSWFCPGLFTMMNLETLYSVWSAVLLERSIVFVSSDLPKLS